MIRTIGLAIAFSPTAERMLAEAVHLTHQFRARLVLIHVGDHGTQEDQLLQSLLEKSGISKESVTLRWEKGDAARAILKACEAEQVDLLLAGALKKEDLYIIISAPSLGILCEGHNAPCCSSPNPPPNRRGSRIL